MAGEAGELIDAIKKPAIYNKPIDLANVLEEMGDLEFYLEGLRQALNITREQVLHANYSKLKVRYQGLVYSDQAAQQRARPTQGEFRGERPASGSGTHRRRTACGRCWRSRRCRRVIRSRLTSCPIWRDSTRGCWGGTFRRGDRQWHCRRRLVRPRNHH